MSVHAAAEWGETPRRSSAPKARRKANIVVANLLFLEEHVRADPARSAGARDRCDAMIGVIADAQIVKLTRMGDTRHGRARHGIAS